MFCRTFMATERLPIVPDDAEEVHVGTGPRALFLIYSCPPHQALLLWGKGQWPCFLCYASFVKQPQPDSVMKRNKLCLCHVSCKTFVDRAGPAFIFHW